MVYDATLMVRRACRRGARGFSLLEVVVAICVLTLGVMVLAECLAMATRANRSARTTTVASVAASNKMEQLRTLVWGFDAVGFPRSDASTDLTVEPQWPTGGPGLTPAPSDSLAGNVNGYFEFVDGRGVSLGAGSSPPATAVYVRRWSMTPLPADPVNGLILQVLVAPWRDRAAADRHSGTGALAEEVRLVGLRMRRAL
jgi:type II secretory pathway pseudopilin PulG